MPSAYPEYEAYEDKDIFLKIHIFMNFTILKGENPAIITHWNNHKG